MSVTNEEQRNVAMVIVAHPDDAEFGCAGTVAAWARNGWETYYVFAPTRQAAPMRRRRSGQRPER
jgi:LmbE family N-acetylglucosaminyl deacetylase